MFTDNYGNVYDENGDMVQVGTAVIDVAVEAETPKDTLFPDVETEVAPLYASENLNDCFCVAKNVTPVDEKKKLILEALWIDRDKLRKEMFKLDGSDDVSNYIQLVRVSSYGDEPGVDELDWSSTMATVKLKPGAGQIIQFEITL